MTEVRVFVSHSFDDADYDGGVQAFRTQVTALVSQACAAMSVEGAEVTPELMFEARKAGRPLMPEIRRQIRSCDFLIADISKTDEATEVNPNVMYEIGYAMALEKETIVFRRATKEPPPSDIRDLLAGSYDKLSDISAHFLESATAAVTQTLASATTCRDRIETSLERVWFPLDVRSISIVCAPDPVPSEFCETDNPNYVDIDRFDDRDAVLELSTFFARRYPAAKVVRYLCGEVPPQALDGNLVILGGPGCVSEEGNEVGRDLMAQLRSKVSYPESGDGLVWGDEQMRGTVLDDQGRVLEDWGSILAAHNPYDPTNRVVVLHGTNTYGTLGAATALIDTPNAMRNHLRLGEMGLKHRLTGDYNFEALVKAEVGPNRRLKPPALQFELIRRIED